MGQSIALGWDGITLLLKESVFLATLSNNCVRKDYSKNCNTLVLERKLVLEFLNKNFNKLKHIEFYKQRLDC